MNGGGAEGTLGGVKGGTRGGVKGGTRGGVKGGMRGGVKGGIRASASDAVMACRVCALSTLPYIKDTFLALGGWVEWGSHYSPPPMIIMQLRVCMLVAKLIHVHHPAPRAFKNIQKSIKMFIYFLIFNFLPFLNNIFLHFS